MKNYTKIAFGALLIASAAFTSCREDDAVVITPEPVKPTIYARLGGTTLVADPDNAGQMIEQGCCQQILQAPKQAYTQELLASVLTV